MSLDHHAYRVGETLLIVAEGDEDFGMTRVTRPEHVDADAVNNLHVVKLVIDAEVVSKGEYRPSESHYGYTAIGDDGWRYECQARSFDDASMQPYCNWQRSFTRGVHYEVAGDPAKITNWLIPKVEFSAHYLNWELTSVTRYFTPAGMDELRRLVDLKYPGVLACCPNVTDWPNPLENARVVHGRGGYDLHYVHRSCYWCRINQELSGTIVRPVIDAEAFVARWREKYRAGEPLPTATGPDSLAARLFWMLVHDELRDDLPGKTQCALDFLEACPHNFSTSYSVARSLVKGLR